MSFTKKIVIDLPDHENHPAELEDAIQAELMAKFLEGKTERPGQLHNRTGFTQYTRNWLDQASVDEYKQFLDALYSRYNLRYTMQVFDL